MNQHESMIFHIFSKMMHTIHHYTAKQTQVEARGKHQIIRFGKTCMGKRSDIQSWLNVYKKRVNGATFEDIIR